MSTASRPARSRRAVAALDIGGTTIKTAIVGPGVVEIGEPVPSGREGGDQLVLDRVAATAQALVERCQELGTEPVGLGAAALGIVDERCGVGRYSAAIGWRDAPIRSRLESVLPCPVAIGHDVRAGGLAEATFGAAAGCGSALFVAAGTGVSAAVIVDGAPIPGASYQAGEVGQLPVAEPSTGAVAGGAEVPLETVCSARAIGERYARATDRLPGAISADEVVALVRKGDRIASAVWTEAVELLGAAIATAIVVADPAVVVIGGGLSRAGAVLIEPLTTVVAEQLLWRTPPPVVSARFGQDAGVIGAAILGWTQAAGLDVAALQGALESRSWSGVP